MKHDHQLFLEKLLAAIDDMSTNERKLDMAELWGISFDSTHDGWWKAEGHGFIGFGRDEITALAHWVVNTGRHLMLCEEYQRTRAPLFDVNEVIRAFRAVCDLPLPQMADDIETELALIVMERAAVKDLMTPSGKQKESQ